MLIIHELTNLPRNYKNLTVSLSQMLLMKTSNIGQEITYQYGWKYKTHSAFEDLWLIIWRRCNYFINELDAHAVNVGQRFVWMNQYNVALCLQPCSECSNYETICIPPRS